MLKTSFTIFNILILLNLTNGATPPFITKCKPDDSNCIKENTKRIIPIFTAGIPEYGVQKLDPLYIKSVNASQGNLLFLVNDATTTGLSNCEVKEISRDLKKSKIHLNVQCTAQLEGQYVLSGSVLVVPLKGDGRIHVDLNSAQIHVVFDMIEKVKDDGKHWFVKSFTYTLDFKEKSNVIFENLYDGNEILGRAAKELVANNGNDIIKEIGQPVISHIIGEIVKNMNHMFKIATLEDLSL